MSKVPLAGRKPHCDSGRMFSDSGSSRLVNIWASTFPVVDRREMPL